MTLAEAATLAVPVPAQQLVLAAWAACGALFLGLGLLAERILEPFLEEAPDLWSVFWTGWAVMVLVLQPWHLFAPINDHARLLLLVLAAAGWLLAGKAPWRAMLGGLRRAWMLLPALAVLALWLSNHALAGPRFGDTGLYLVPAMHWDKSYAVVPGLANLFVSLGYNLSYFLYGAVIDAGPWQGRIYHVINSTLAFAVLARGLLAAGSLLRRDPRPLAPRLFQALAMGPTVELANSLYLTSPMPDTAVFLFGIVLAGELVGYLSDPRPTAGAMARVVLLAAVGITIKLSIAGLAVATAGIAYLWWMWRERPGLASWGWGTAAAAAMGLAVIAPWMTLNAISSGYPLYPAFVFPLPVDWIAKVDATKWIQKPMELAPLSTIFTQPAWWHQRLLSLGWMEPDAVRPLTAIAGAAVLACLARPLAWWRGRAAAVPMLVLLAPVCGFFFAFLNTPMPRYQGATLWIAAMLLVVVALAPFLASRALRIAIAAAVVAACFAPLGVEHEEMLALRDFEPSGRPVVHPMQLASGLVVNVPENQTCWDAELPCTSEPHPGLRLREPGNLAAGFAINDVP